MSVDSAAISQARRGQAVDLQGVPNSQARCRSCLERAMASQSTKLDESTVRIFFQKFSEVRKTCE